MTDIAGAAVFLFIGLSTCAIAAIRHRRGLRALVWIGIWSATYGAMQACQVRAVVAALPVWSRAWVPYAEVSMTYLILVPAALSFLDLSQGGLRTLILAAAGLGFAIAVAGISFFALTGSRNSLMLSNNLLAALILVILVIVLSTPGLSMKYLALQYRGVVVAGLFAFALEALYSNLSRHLAVEPLRVLDHLGFAALLFSFGYAALRMVLENERRLLAVQNELEIARRIQLATLPHAVPEVQGLRVSAAYRPMTAVAGDFYDFIRVDENRVGILVADVAGHGVPAALIASMLKVVMPSVAACAQDPRAVLQGLNRVFVGQSPTQLISAAYLWLDTQARTARYSAAGHPPLLRWRQGQLERWDSNGCLIGVLAESDYPVVSMAIDSGERFLIYTDGVTEVENGRGEFFDEARLEQVFRENQSRTPAELSTELLREVDGWRPPSVPQQDDITLVVIDVA